MNYRNLRKIKGYIMLIMSTMAAVIGVILLFAILYKVIQTGMAGLNLSLFTQDEAPAWLEGEGGMRHAFIGQIILTFFASLIGIPIGILGGIYLSEYGRYSKLGRFISSLADVSVSIPTIIIGTFIYSLLVKPFGVFNGWAGSVALAVILIPVIMRTTEDSLKLIPFQLREAALALGTPYYKVIKDIILKSALTGIFTGVSLAIARVAGETAPLLFTSFNNKYLSCNMNEPMPSLTVTIFQYASSPYESWIISAWASSLVITVFILLSNIILKQIMKKRSF
ncbi:MAG: phosphate ABC transporter permease PstA [Mucispirillum sp.]|uniref:Phosphate transport system permease protein PstA n=1 Tax=Candidatus Mucispirillum faecigallinarum TaxID=2838699 RepID=A0A9D2GTN6_9BACT|nr:phosphate ABC transporter permease PstA [Mucispirillum sp.]HIZ89803.1 phosphate ABC transporter permease PstA [Candidatus Mucispirillum faecigallinarum]